MFGCHHVLTKHNTRLHDSTGWNHLFAAQVETVYLQHLDQMGFKQLPLNTKNVGWLGPGLG
jgi:hypothetical protein